MSKSYKKGKYETKDSGKRRVLDTGAQRDKAENKHSPASIPFEEINRMQREITGVDFDIDTNKELVTEPEENLIYDDLRLIHPLFLNRLEALLERGAAKYFEYNWLLGMPLSWYYDSALRHLYQAMQGDTSEDHLSAATFNIMCAMVTEHLVRYSERPLELADEGAIAKDPDRHVVQEDDVEHVACCDLCGSTRINLLDEDKEEYHCYYCENIWIHSEPSVDNPYD